MVETWHPDLQLLAEPEAEAEAEAEAEVEVETSWAADRALLPLRQAA